MNGLGCTRYIRRLSAVLSAVNRPRFPYSGRQRYVGLRKNEPGAIAERVRDISLCLSLASFLSLSPSSLQSNQSRVRQVDQRGRPWTRKGGCLVS